MAKRPIFYPAVSDSSLINVAILEFDWYPGFAKSQAQKSIASLHAAAKNHGVSPVLEISSKSAHPLGVALSAFNLKILHGQKAMSVESAFQGSKVFVDGGPFHDLYDRSSRDAKTDERLRTSGKLIGFNLLGDQWPIRPETCFYDWIYVTAVSQHPELAHEMLDFNGFTDIAFNPEKSLNCQARSAALYVALSRRGMLGEAIRDASSYLSLVNQMQGIIANSSSQNDLLSSLD